LDRYDKKVCKNKAMAATDESSSLKSRQNISVNALLVQQKKH